MYKIQPIDKVRFISYICCYKQLNKNYTNKNMTLIRKEILVEAKVGDVVKAHTCFKSIIK